MKGLRAISFKLTTGIMPIGDSSAGSRKDVRPFSFDYDHGSVGNYEDCEIFPDIATRGTDKSRRRRSSTTRHLRSIKIRFSFILNP